MDIFWRLLCAHLLSDFTLQTDALAEWKSRNALGTFVHSIVFLLISSILTLTYISKIWIYLIIIWIVHFVIDYIRVILIKTSVIKDSLYFFMIDQALHLVSILILYKAILSKISLVPANSLIIALSIFIIGTHFITILIYYLEMLIYGSSSIEWKEKYFGIIERMLLIGCFLLPGIWWLVFPCVGIIRWYIYRNSLINLNFRPINIIVSISSGITVGMFLKMFFMPLY